MILLVNPLVTFDGFLKQRYASSLSLGYIASYLQKNLGLKSQIVDCVWQDFPHYFRKFRPRIVGISAMFWQFNALIKISKYIKKVSPSTKVIVGGYLPTFSSESIFKTLGNKVDFLVVGEGEQTFLELVQRILIGSNHFDDIRGIAFLRQGTSQYTPKRELIQDLDSFPFPIRKIRFRSASVATSRGCIFNCSFCSIKNFYSRKYRTRSVENVIAELVTLKRKGVKYLKFLDDNAIISYPYFQKFFGEYISKKLYTMKSSIKVSGAIFLNHPEVMDSLRKMNVIEISVGIETLSEEGKKIFMLEDKIEDTRRLLRIISQSSFNGSINFYQILNTGFEKSIQEVKHNSMQLVRAVKGIHNVSIIPLLVQPWPGSDIREIFLKEGFKVADVLHLNCGGSGVSSPNTTGEELNKWALEYDLLLRKQKLNQNSNSLFWGLILFATSSILLKTKLKMLQSMLFYYLRVNPIQDPWRMQNSTKTFF